MKIPQTGKPEWVLLVRSLWTVEYLPWVYITARILLFCASSRLPPSLSSASSRLSSISSCYRFSQLSLYVLWASSSYLRKILHQEAMSTNHLGLPSLPSSAYCCANLGQHTRDPLISVPPSSSFIYCARTLISVSSAIFELKNALLRRVPFPVISHFALVLSTVRFVAFLHRYFALPLRVQASVPSSQVPTSNKLVVDFALPSRVLHPSNTYFALIFASVHLASLWVPNMHCFGK